VVTSHWLGPKNGLPRGFAQLEQLPELLASGEKVTQIAIDWLEQPGSEPFFLFLHYYDVHTPYAPKAAFRQELVREYHGIVTGATSQLNEVRKGELELDARDVRHLSDLYDAEILQLDAQLARLFEALETSGLADETLVVVTSDHGEEFLEHGSVLHGRTFFEEMVRVPLIIAGPGVERGRRVAEPVMLVDVVPTVLARLGVPVPAPLDGVDLLDDARGEPDEPRLVFSAADWKNEPPDRKRMLRRGRYKLIFDRITEKARLYDLETDPLEQRNLAYKQPERVQALLAELPRFTARQREADAVPERSAEEEQLLRELGYVD
jgi:arylsulfatase A-like enzyme